MVQKESAHSPKISRLEKKMILNRYRLQTWLYSGQRRQSGSVVISFTCRHEVDDEQWVGDVGTAGRAATGLHTNFRVHTRHNIYQTKMSSINALIYGQWVLPMLFQYYNIDTWRNNIYKQSQSGCSLYPIISNWANSKYHILNEYAWCRQSLDIRLKVEFPEMYAACTYSISDSPFITFISFW